MQRVAFKMFLFPGMKQEYKKRHNEIWPELTKLLHDAGIRNYSIHLDEGSNTLFGYLEQNEGHDDGRPSKTSGDAEMVGPHEGCHGI